VIVLTAAAVAAGAILVGATSWDIALTVLHPGARGPISYRANRAAWALVRAMSVRLDSRRLLSFAGPLAMGVNVVLWVAVLWLGFALVYVPFEAVYDALYISGQSLTTVGFGDIVAEADALRAISAFESAAGLGAFTAAIAYVLSVYPLVTAIRASALHVADMGIDGPEGATRVIATGGSIELAAQLRAMTESHEHIRRFQILYYFESGDTNESLGRLLRAGCATYLVLRWGIDAARVPVAGVYAPAYERALDRLLTDFETDYVGGRRRQLESPEGLEGQEAKEALERIREAVRRAAPELVAYGEAGLEDLDRFLARAQSVTSAFAREHRQREIPIVG